MKNAVLEGCNSDWSQQRYLPFLINKAAKGNIELWAVDVQPKIQLTSAIASLWQAAQSKGKACYLNKVQDKQAYEKLSNVDYVFVVSPDQYHCEIAGFWLERLNPGGRIFVEKPLDASLRQVRELKERLDKQGRHNTVYGFDHYLARAYPFLQKQDGYLGEIGKVEKIEFHILEPFGIPPNRVNALDKGMIFDLFCHVLAVVGQILTPLANTLPKVELTEVKTAQYIDCPISGETFAWIKFTVNQDIEVISAVGKCINKFEDKSAIIYGSRGRIKLDFINDKFLVTDRQGNQQERRLESRHVESFLEAVLQQKNPMPTPGVLSFDAAFEILRILEEAKRRIEKMPQYRCGESVDEILKRF